VAEVERQLQERVERKLEELTNFAMGKELNLTNMTAQERERAVYEKADELYRKHEQLTQAEQELNYKFEQAKERLIEYQAKFQKNKATLIQDHDTFVKIKTQTERDMLDQIAIQQDTQVYVSEALEKKASLEEKEAQLNFNSSSAAQSSHSSSVNESSQVN
jgi:acyl-CoA reductase-like NAD-dependent aldehyde dehydrogenase